MNLKKVKFVFSKNEELENLEREMFINAYHNYFIKVYGHDLYDAYLKVINSKSYQEPNDDVLEMAPNSKRIVATLKDIQNKKNILLLKIYYHNSLIGFSKIKLVRKTVYIEDIVFLDNIKNISDLWEYTLKFLCDYYEENNFNKIYVEIPLTAVKLLLRADKLGFKESPKDIKIEDTVTYKLNKELR